MHIVSTRKSTFIYTSSLKLEFVIFNINGVFLNQYLCTMFVENSIYMYISLVFAIINK